MGCFDLLCYTKDSADGTKHLHINILYLKTFSHHITDQKGDVLSKCMIRFFCSVIRSSIKEFLRTIWK